LTAAVLTPTENQLFDALWGYIDAVFGSTLSANIFKGFQNMTATPPGASYVVLQPGIVVRQNQLRRDYDAASLVVNVERDTEYLYQCDCYGPIAPDLANTIAIAWPSLWTSDFFNGYLAMPTSGAPLPVTPLYADEPQQLNIVNAELQYEQRFMLRLHLQANQTVSLPQEFFSTAPELDLTVPADYRAP